MKAMSTGMIIGIVVLGLIALAVGYMTYDHLYSPNAQRADEQQKAVQKVTQECIDNPTLCNLGSVFNEQESE